MPRSRTRRRVVLRFEWRPHVLCNSRLSQTYVCTEMVSGLSPESYGTLRALRLKKKLRYFEERIAAELEAAGYARRVERTLVATPKAVGFRPRMASNRQRLEAKI